MIGRCCLRELKKRVRLGGNVLNGGRDGPVFNIHPSCWNFKLQFCFSSVFFYFYFLFFYLFIYFTDAMQLPHFIYLFIFTTLF